MRPLYKMELIQLEITNACTHHCQGCSHLCPHQKHPFFMDLATAEKAIMSLEIGQPDGYRGHIGVMGGEPTLHPQFREILDLLRNLVPDRRKRELWTAGYRWREYQVDIVATFDSDLIAFNDHRVEGKHRPPLVAIQDVVADPIERWRLIHDCWVQNRWSASMTPKGGFFCEVAAAFDHAFDGPGGWPIVPHWWHREAIDLREQIDRWCQGCGMAAPLPVFSDQLAWDWATPENLVALRESGSPKMARGQVRLWREREHGVEGQADSRPQNYRAFVAHKPEDIPCKP